MVSLLHTLHFLVQRTLGASAPVNDVCLGRLWIAPGIRVTLMLLLYTLRPANHARETSLATYGVHHPV